MWQAMCPHDGPGVLLTLRLSPQSLDPGGPSGRETKPTASKQRWSLWAGRALKIPWDPCVLWAGDLPASPLPYGRPTYGDSTLHRVVFQELGCALGNKGEGKERMRWDTSLERVFRRAALHDLATGSSLRLCLREEPELSMKKCCRLVATLCNNFKISMKVKGEWKKTGLKLNIQEMKIVASGPITSW